jgi:hypothetical protein
MAAIADDATYWRARASDARLLAQQMTSPDTRLGMLQIAVGYEALANHAERRARKPTRVVDSGVPERSEIDATGEGAQPMEGASFGPDALKAICRAFDIAWRSIAAQFAGDQAKAEAARIALANCLLSVADEDSRDVEVLATGALDALTVEQRAILFSN